MSVEQGFIEYIFEVRGANAVRKEFDTIADAAQAGEVGFEQLEKVIAAVEGRAPRLAASLRKVRSEMEAQARAAKQLAAAETVRPGMLKAAGDAGNAQADRDRRRRIEEIGKERYAREQLERAIERERSARDAIRNIGNPGNDVAKIQQLEKAHGQLAVAIRSGERAQRDLARETEANNRGIVSQRYALYDIANMYGLVGTAMAGAAIYAGVVGAQFQTAFTNVERTLDPMNTTAESVDRMRQSLIQLQGQAPLTFAELSQIATIGNQMGIAEDSLIDFTGTIARFASVSGVSIEETAKAFGGFMEQTGLAPEYLENLGSSLALVSLKSNATEAEILATSKQIAALSANAGMSADQIVGLASTFAALRIQPEAARGALGMYFGTLRKAVANGGSDLQNFATVVGVTTDELDRMVRAGEGASVLEGFLTNLNATDAVGVTQALDALGLSQLRVDNAFVSLSNRLGTFTSQMSLAKTGFIEGAELNRQYAMTVDDLSSQWTILVNGLNSLIATMSGGAVEGLAGLLTMVNRVIYAFQEWLEGNPWARYMIAFGVAIVGVVGVMALFQMVVFRANAALLAFRLASLEAGRAGLSAGVGIRGLASGLIGVGQAGTVAARGLSIFKRALVSTGIGALVVGAGFLAEKLIGTANGADDASLSLGEYNKIAKSAKSASGGAADSASNLADQLGGGGGGGGGGVAKAAEEAAKKVRLLTDYASDLSGVFSRSFSLRFDSGAAMDSVTSKWIKLREESEKYRREVAQLTADKSLRQYWLGVAEAYDDQLRAGQLRAELADIDAKLAEAQAGASTELRGNSQAAINNRDTMRGLTGEYRKYIETLAASGASQQFIQSEIKRLNSEFVNQATALGYNRTEIQEYSLAFQDMANVVAGVPRDVTIDFIGDPALQALAEFNAKLDEQARVGGAAAGVGAGESFGDGLNTGLGNLDIPMPELEEDPEVSGEEAGNSWVFGLAKKIKEWDTRFADGIRSMFKSWGEGAVDAFTGAFSDSDGISSLLKAIPVAGAWLGSWYDAGRNGSKETKKGAEAEATESKVDLFTKWFGEEWSSGWEEGGKAGAKSLNKGVEENADPDGSIVRKLGGGGGGGKGGMSAMSAMGNLGRDGALEFNKNTGTTADPQGILSTKINGAKTPLSTLLGTIAAFGAGMYNTSLGGSANASGVLGSNAEDARGPIGTGLGSVGYGGGASYNSRLGSAANTGGVISDNIGAGQWRSETAASSLGGAIANSLGGGISWVLDSLFGKSGTPRDVLKKLTGFSGGGYTGAGGVNEPKGIVHGGEYVIPKRYVNQRTGIPDMSYVQSIQHSRSAPKTSYATGGHVTGGGMSAGPIDLSVRSVQMLSRALKTELSIDGRLIGDAANRSFKQGNMVGAS